VHGRNCKKKLLPHMELRGRVPHRCLTKRGAAEELPEGQDIPRAGPENDFVHHVCGRCPPNSYRAEERVSIQISKTKTSTS
jgi:hypothetical protein